MQVEDHLATVGWRKMVYAERRRKDAICWIREKTAMLERRALFARSWKGGDGPRSKWINFSVFLDKTLLTAKCPVESRSPNLLVIYPDARLRKYARRCTTTYQAKYILIPVDK